MTGRLRSAGGPGLCLGAAAIVAIGGLTLGTSGTLSASTAWTQSTLANPVDTAATATLAVTHTSAGGSCVGGPRTATVGCAGTLTPSSGVPASSSDTIANLTGAPITQSLTATSCAPVRFVNDLQATAPMLPRNDVAFQQTDPWGTSSAARFSAKGYANDIVGTNGGGLLGLLTSSYSLGVWFNASDNQGGGLISLDPSLADTKTSTANPGIWLDSTGHVAFSANSTLATLGGASPSTYLSGWHLAVLTVDTTGLLTLTKTVRLYVDGSQVASASGLTLLSGSASGYWHLGWADFTGLAQPSSAYFHGTMSGAFVNQTSALSAAQVATLTGSASASGYQSLLAGQSGTASTWMLGDDGTTTYGGTLPGTLASPCDKVNVALAFTNPAATIGPISLTSFVAGSPRTLVAPAVGQSQGLTISTSTGSGYSGDLAGLHLYVPLTFVYGTSPASAWTMTMRWAGDPREVILG